MACIGGFCPRTFPPTDFYFYFFDVSLYMDESIFSLYTEVYLQRAGSRLFFLHTFGNEVSNSGTGFNFPVFSFYIVY